MNDILRLPSCAPFSWKKAQEVLATIRADDGEHAASPAVSQQQKCQKPRKRCGSRGGIALQHCWVCGIGSQNSHVPDHPKRSDSGFSRRELVAKSLHENW